MGLLGRKKKDKEEDVDEESASQEDVEDETASLDDISLIDDNEGSSPFGASFSGPSDEDEEDESDGSASVLEGLDLGAPVGEDDSSSDDNDPLGGDLLSIFTDEEEASEDLSVLTQDLEDIDMNELLAELQNVATRLRSILNIQ